MEQQKQLHLIMEWDLQWFAKDGPGGEKTEPATAKKLREAREDGKVVKSKELTAAFDLIILFLVLKIFVSFVGNRLMNSFVDIYGRIPDFVRENAVDVTEKSVAALMSDALIQILIVCVPFFAFGFVVQPKFDKFNPINGFKRIFSKDSIFELVKSILKIFVIVYVAYTSIRGHAQDIFILYEIPLMQAIMLCGTVIINAGLKISLVYLVIGLADFIYQKYRFNEDMKMTKQEVKDEFKNTEGNPEIKGRQRQRMREASRRRMMQDVPKADVVITNPTHFAVAIKYDAETSKAPVVLAKGEDYLAQKIKEAAREHHIEIVENKPLARMLYANVDIGQEIPPELYQAVAEILAMVYNMREK